MLKAELQVLFIFLRQRWHTYDSSGQVDSFMLAQQTAVHDLAINVVATNGRYSQFDQAIRKQDARTRLHFLGQGLESSREQSCGAGNVARRNGQLRSALDRDRCPVLQS